MYLQQVDVFNIGKLGFRCETNTSPTLKVSYPRYVIETKVENKAWVEHPASHYGEVVYIGCNSCVHTPLLFKVAVESDNVDIIYADSPCYLLLSNVDVEQLRVEDFLDKPDLSYITRSVLAKRYALRLHSFVLSNSDISSVKCAFDILTDTVHLPKDIGSKPTNEYTFVNTEYISTKLKSLIGDVSRSNFTHTSSYDEDIDLYIDYINKACEFLRDYSGFSFFYTVSLQRDAQA